MTTIAERPRRRNLKLSDFHISKEKYNELKYFCLQYEEKKQRLAQSYGIKACTPREGSRTNHIGKPTEEQAIRNVMLKDDIELIEETARETDEDIAPYIMKSVTEGMTYEYMDVPMGRKQFYEARRLFFYLLAQKR